MESGGPGPKPASGSGPHPSLVQVPGSSETVKLSRAAPVTESESFKLARQIEAAGPTAFKLALARALSPERVEPVGSGPTTLTLHYAEPVPEFRERSFSLASTLLDALRRHKR
eukprot:1923284-Rhodomonas_salina.1